MTQGYFLKYLTFGYTCSCNNTDCLNTPNETIYRLILPGQLALYHGENYTRTRQYLFSLEAIRNAQKPVQAQHPNTWKEMKPSILYDIFPLAIVIFHSSEKDNNSFSWDSTQHIDCSLSSRIRGGLVMQVSQKGHGTDKCPQQLLPYEFRV